MATQKRPGYWQACRTVKGKKYWGFGSTAEAAEIDAAINAGIIKTEQAREGSLGKFVTAYWLPSIQELSPLSIRRYTDLYESHVAPKLATAQLDAITPLVVRSWYDNLDAQPNTKQYALDILRRILAMAVDLEVIDSNPCSKVKIKPIPKITRERILGNAEALQLLEAVKGTSLSAPVYLASVLALRRGEVCALQWKNIGDDGLVKIVEQRQTVYAIRGKGLSGHETKKPKRGKVRAFYVPAGILEELRIRGDQDHRLVCTSKGKAWRPDTLTRTWGEFAEQYEPEAGKFPLKDWSFHDLRHLAVGLLRRAKADYLLIQTICGHTNTAQTLDYMALETVETRDALGSLMSMLDSGSMPSSMPNP